MNIFCSFNFIDEKGSGFGNTMIQTNEKFPLPLSEIRRFERELRKRNGFKNVVILNFTELGGAE